MIYYVYAFYGDGPGVGIDFLGSFDLEEAKKVLDQACSREGYLNPKFNEPCRYMCGHILDQEGEKIFEQKRKWEITQEILRL